MGCWDVYCILCGLPPNNLINEDEQKNIKNINKITKWLNKCTILTQNNNIIHNCEETACNNSFVSRDNNNYYAEITNKISLEKTGIFIHDDCWNYVKKKYNIELKYGDFAIKQSVQNIQSDYIPYVKYKNIEKYWEQFFNYEDLINDNNVWMCESPLKSKKNALRINKIIKQLKIKKDRTGPSASASLFPTNTIKYGNNKKFWINSCFINICES